MDWSVLFICSLIFLSLTGEHCMSYISSNSKGNNTEHHESLENLEPKVRMISEENFALLKTYQHKIFEATEVTPSLRKILNSLITRENLESISKSIITSLA